jgi:ABC-type sugar transport system permease subunit
MRSRTRSGARRREIGLAYLLLAPALLLLGGVLAYPLGWEIWASFTSLSPLQDGSPAFVGLENYRHHLADSQFWLAATVTVVHGVVTSVAKVVLGLGFALLLARPFRGRAVVFLAVFLPWAYPASVSVIGWYWTLSPPITTAYSVFMGSLKYAVDNALGTGAWVFLSGEVVGPSVGQFYAGQTARAAGTIALRAAGSAVGISSLVGCFND